jgi:hypothetical protein
MMYLLVGSDGAATFDECMNLCDKKSGCVDVAYSGKACYFKGGLGEPNQNPNVWGAVQLSGCTTSKKLKLHRKRVQPVKRQLVFGPDFTFTQGIATVVSTATSHNVVQT